MGYGSFARNQASDWSDIDLLVLKDADDRANKKLEHDIWDMSRDIKSDRIFDIRVITPEEYENVNHLTIFYEIKREGIMIYKKST